VTWEIWFDPDCAPVLIPSSDGEREQVRKILEATKQKADTDSGCLEAKETHNKPNAWNPLHVNNFRQPLKRENNIIRMKQTKTIEFSAERMVGDWWAITVFGRLDGRSGPRGLQSSSDKTGIGLSEKLAWVNYDIVRRVLVSEKWRNTEMGVAIRKAQGAAPKHDGWPSFAADIIEQAVEVYPTIRTDLD